MKNVVVNRTKFNERSKRARVCDYLEKHGYETKSLGKDGVELKKHLNRNTKVVLGVVKTPELIELANKV